jgi:hypothetical protein
VAVELDEMIAFRQAQGTGRVHFDKQNSVVHLATTYQPAKCFRRHFVYQNQGVVWNQSKVPTFFNLYLNQ